MSTHLLRLNRRVLTVFLLVSVPILIFGVALVLMIGQSRMRDGYGRQIEDVRRQGFAAAAGVDANGDGRVDLQDGRAVARRIFAGG